MGTDWDTSVGAASELTRFRGRGRCSGRAASAVSGATLHFALQVIRGDRGRVAALAVAPGAPCDAFQLRVSHQSGDPFAAHTDAASELELGVHPRPDRHDAAALTEPATPDVERGTG